MLNALKRHDPDVLVGVEKIRQIDIDWITKPDGTLDDEKIVKHFKPNQYTLIDGVETEYHQKPNEVAVDYRKRIAVLAEKHGRMAAHVRAVVPGCFVTFYHIVGRDLYNAIKLHEIKQPGDSSYSKQEIEQVVERQHRREETFDALMPLYSKGRCNWLAWGCYKVQVTKAFDDSLDNWLIFARDNTKFYQRAGLPVVALVYHVPIDTKQPWWAGRDLYEIQTVVELSGGIYAPWSGSGEVVGGFTAWHEGVMASE